MMRSLELRHLTVDFGTVRALEDVSTTVHPGVTVLLGENGAGKTTLMRTLATLQTPTQGEVLVDGLPVRAGRGGLRAAVGYMPQDIPRSPMMSTLHYLEYFAYLKGIDAAAQSRESLLAALTAVGLEDKARTRVSGLSGGMVRRLGLAVARLGSPDLLLLDEPTAGLDPLQRVEMRELFTSGRAQQRILVSTHLAEDVAAVADRIVMIHRGRVAFDGTLADFAPTEGGERPRADDVEQAFLARSRGGAGGGR